MLEMNKEMLAVLFQLLHCKQVFFSGSKCVPRFSLLHFLQVILLFKVASKSSEVPSFVPKKEGCDVPFKKC